MDKNITLVIGDNASGKTRFLADRIRQSKINNDRVTTNLKALGLNKYSQDSKKLNNLLGMELEIVDRVRDDKAQSAYNLEVKDIIDFIVSKGDILVLDELDKGLIAQDLIDICEVISLMKDDWQEIYISGYSPYLLRMFHNEDMETGITYRSDNVIYITDKGDTVDLTEDEIIGYINKIRG